MSDISNTKEMYFFIILKKFKKGIKYLEKIPIYNTNEANDNCSNKERGGFLFLDAYEFKIK